MHHMINRIGILLLALPLFGLVACQDSPRLGLADTDRSQPGPVIVWDPLRRPQPELPFPNDLALKMLADGSLRFNVSQEGETKIDASNRLHLTELDGFSGLSPITVAFDGPLDVSTVTDDSVFVVNVDPNSKRYGERIPLDLGRGWYPHQARPRHNFPRDPLRDYDSFVMPPDNMVDINGDGTPDKWVYHYEVSTHTLDIRPLIPMATGSRYAVVLTKKVKGWDKNGRYGPIQSPFDIINHDSQTADLKLALPSLDKVGVKLEDIAFGWTLSTGDLSRTFRNLRDGLYGSGPFAWLNDQFPAKMTEIDRMDIAFDGSVEAVYPPDNPYPVVPWDHQYVLQGEFLRRIVGLINAVQPGVADGFDYGDYAVFGEMETPDLRNTPDKVWVLDQVSGKVAQTQDDGTAKMVPEARHEKVPFFLVVPKTTANHKPPFPVLVYAHATGTSRIEALLMADRFAQSGIATFAIDAVGHGPVLADPLKFLAAKGGQYVPLVRTMLGQLIFPNAEQMFPESMSDKDVITQMLKNGFVQQLAVKGRAFDDNGDCEITNGEGYYSPNAFRLRDSMRQTTLDYIVAVRMLHSLTQAGVPKAPADPGHATKEALMPSLLAGDFNCDGVLDIGGEFMVGTDGKPMLSDKTNPDGSARMKPQPYFMMGISLGGVHTALTAPLEPYIVAVAPDVPGAGLADIFIRTGLGQIAGPLMQKISGVMVVGCPMGADEHGNNRVRMSLNDDSNNCQDQSFSTFRDWNHGGVCVDDAVDVSVTYSVVTEAGADLTHRGEILAPIGATVRVHDLTAGTTAETKVEKDGGFAVAIACDIDDILAVDVMGADGNVVSHLTMKSPYEGLGRTRNTPDFRRFVQLASNVLEGADAITVADRVLLDPAQGRQPEWPVTNMLMMLSVGDGTVVFAQGLALARSIGLFGRDKDLQKAVADPFAILTDFAAPYRAWTEQVIALGILVSKDVPPPLLNPARPLNGEGTGLCSIIPSQITAAGPLGKAMSALCLADVHGHHEYIATVDKNDSFPPSSEIDPVTQKPKYHGTYTQYHRNLIATYLHSLATKVTEDACWGDVQCVTDHKLRDEWDLPLGQTLP